MLTMKARLLVDPTMQPLYDASVGCVGRGSGAWWRSRATSTPHYFTLECVNVDVASHSSPEGGSA